MHFLHVADSHLGYSAYHKLNENGLNQREVDTYNSFKQFVDYAIASKPDMILHSGDLFDSVRPTNRAIKFAMEQIIRISENDIPMVIISGNHETPKMRETGSPLSFFEHLKNIYVVYKGKYEKIEIGDAMIHAIPHCFSKEELIKNIELAKKIDGYFNISMMHVGIFGIKEFSRGDFNEQIIPSGYLSPDFDYIALGHYHTATKVTENSYYSGSTEYFSFKEVGGRKGFYDIKMSDGIDINFMPLKTRSMIDFGSIDCNDLPPDEITEKIIKKFESGIEGKIIRIFLKNLNLAKHKSIDWNKIKKMASKSLHFEVGYDLKEIKYEMASKSRMASLEEEWRNYISSVPIERKKEIGELALKYLSEAKG
ncbi:MAG: DNA repair exonuclease [Thermoplasmata archaeon]|nr:DNA repair exonuclease [Thermoplasmata archaeon]